MFYKEKELEYAKLVKLHRENSPIMGGFYHSLDVIDGKIQALLAFIGMQMVAITFMHGIVFENAETVPPYYQIIIGGILAPTILCIFVSAIMLVSCLTIIGPDHRGLMKDLRKLTLGEEGEENSEKIATEVTGRVAEITGSRRARYRVALYLTILSSFLLACTIFGHLGLRFMFKS